MPGGQLNSEFVRSLRIELLLTPDCPHGSAAEETLRSALTVDGREPLVERIYINDLDHAAGLGFHGSPTIRIAGRDVAPPSADLPIGLACRLYPQPDGSPAGVVPAETIRAAAERVEEQRAQLAAARAARPKLRELPWRASRSLLLWLSRRRFLGRLAVATPLTRPLVRRFIAGQTLDETLGVLERLRSRGLRWTVDVLGEAVASPEMARAAADRYVATLGALAERGLEANVSLKLTQMGLGVDVDFCTANVRRIVHRAADIGAFMRIDMEDHTLTETTLRIGRQLHADYHDVGVVIQSYLRRSAADVEQLIAEQIRVRLCKGAYDEPPDVAYTSKVEVDDSFRRLAERLLLEGRYPALATHDDRLIEDATHFAEQNGIDPSRFEFQMLYGVRRELQEALVARGYTVRVYVPYGSEWFPYYMRRLAERPANVLFILRSILPERRS
ncbi:MAG TPA: proline dehydrogenase family protein [Candidatus Limnocylindria bacterium]|nr:proline dehydrogenase family protein [Candidatus Limnocylindria bacterium]